MDHTFKIADIYDKNLNFLFGSGASHGLFPTLALNIKDGDESLTIESLATIFKERGDDDNYTLLFMHYYINCIEPVIKFDINQLDDKSQKKVIQNYESFLETILSLLNRKKSKKSCNLFTTNYDGCFHYTSDRLLENGVHDFLINDGARGFHRRVLNVRNFNTLLLQSGVFGRYREELCQINLMNLHGSAYWYREGESIKVDYSHDRLNERLITDIDLKTLEKFSSVVMDSSKTLSDLPKIELDQHQKDNFWTRYKKLPIVNPTKWKFHETVFEEHYHQMLRLLSYELEKPNTVLVTFGFSFADEHILNLIKRSLSNPSLQVYISCFDKDEFATLSTIFKKFKNVRCLSIEGYLNFSKFNEEVFCISKKTSDQGANLTPSSNDEPSSELSSSQNEVGEHCPEPEKGEA